MASVSSTCSAIIHILDQNDNAPYFSQKVYRGEISESAPIASLVLSTEDDIIPTSSTEFLPLLGSGSATANTKR